MRGFSLRGAVALTAVLLVGASAVYADEVNCPICGMTLNSHEVRYKAIYKGQTYYFMSAEHKAQFLKNPKKFAQAPINYKSVLTTSREEIRPGKPVTLQIMLRDPGTHKPVTGYRIVHEQKMHLIMASEDLSWFAHEHPTPGKNGVFTLKNFAFPHPGNYRLYADVTPEKGGHQIKMMDLTVIGEPPAAQPLAPDTIGEKSFGDYTLSLQPDKPLTVGTMVGLRVRVQKGGRAVTDIKPWLGASAHMVGLSEDGKAFVHAHPEGEPKPMNGPELTFHTTFTKPGVYKLWAQMDHDGEVRTFPFVVEVSRKQAAGLKEVFTCPVVGGKTDPAKKASAEYSDYKGMRYYFCCPGCKPKFDAAPAKYAKSK